VEHAVDAGSVYGRERGSQRRESASAIATAPMIQTASASTRPGLAAAPMASSCSRTAPSSRDGTPCTRPLRCRLSRASWARSATGRGILRSGYGVDVGAMAEVHGNRGLVRLAQGISRPLFAISAELLDGGGLGS